MMYLLISQGYYFVIGTLNRKTALHRVSVHIITIYKKFHNIVLNLGWGSHIGDVTGVFLYLQSMAQPIDLYIFEPFGITEKSENLHKRMGNDEE